jgi:hypothetical protein
MGNVCQRHSFPSQDVNESEDVMAGKTRKTAGNAKPDSKGKSAADEASKAAAAVTASAASPPPSAGGAIEALKQDHRRVEQLFADYEGASDDNRKDELVQEICTELIIHTRLEEEIFYVACRSGLSEEDLLDEAQVEHDSAKLLIVDLMEASAGDRFRDAKVWLLSEQIKHHVGEEEKPDDGIFAQARAHGLDTVDLASRLKERKEDLQGRAADLRPTRAVSLNLGLDPYTQQEERMARNSGSNEGRDRDERGRFISDDDDRDDRRSSARGGGRRSDDDDDRGGRGRGRGGWFGDSEGHAEAARRRRDDDDRGGSRSRSRDDDDDDDRGGRGRGRGGWFGDSEGHAEAARRRRDDDDRGGSRSRDRGDDDDDRRGSRSRSRDDDDDDDRGRGRGRGGWFGDSEGHAEAARRRWEDDDRGGSRSRSRDDDDDDDRRGGSRSRRRSSEGQGGWFGDSRGHAQAARRGWESRR